MSEQVSCFWNHEREVYEISRYGKIIAETTESKYSMDICRLDLEVNMAQDNLLTLAKRFDSLVKAFPPEEQGE